jgi:Ca2+-binding EF-hand superfamily protein
VFEDAHESLTLDLKAITLKLAEKSHTNESLVRERDGLRFQLDEAKAQLRASQQYDSKFRDDYAKLRKLHSRCENEHQQLTAAISEGKQTTNALETELRALKDRHAELHSTSSNVSEEYDILVEALAQTTRERDEALVAFEKFSAEAKDAILAVQEELALARSSNLNHDMTYQSSTKENVKHAHSIKAEDINILKSSKKDALRQKKTSSGANSQRRTITNELARSAGSSQRHMLDKDEDLVDESDEKKLRQKLRAASFTSYGDEDWSKLFQIADKDRSGDMTVDELRLAIRRFGKLSAEKFPDKLVEKLFRMIDSDHNGSITSSQFVDWIGKGQPTPSPVDPSKRFYWHLHHNKELEKPEEKVELTEDHLTQLRRKMRAASFSAGGSAGTEDWAKLFKVHDRENASELSLEDIRRAIRKDGKLTASVFPDELVEIVFSLIDSDNDGFISADEFVDWISNGKFSHDGGGVMALVDKTMLDLKRRDTALGVNNMVQLRQQMSAALTSAGSLDWINALASRYFVESNLIEWRRAVRKEGKISPVAFSDELLELVFRLLDTDNSATICSVEFVAWFQSGRLSMGVSTLTEHAAAKLCDLHWQPASSTSDTLTQVRQKLHLASNAAGGDSWLRVFEHPDRSTVELSLEQLHSALRRDCKLSSFTFSDDLIEATFHLIDTDNDDLISCFEFMTWLRTGKLFMDVSSSAVYATKVITDFQRREEKNFSNTVAQVRRKMRAVLYSAAGDRFLNLFRSYNLVNSSNISFDELRRTIRKDGKISASVLPDDLIKLVFRIIDSNNDGAISPTEFVSWFGEEILTVCIPSPARTTTIRAEIPSTHIMSSVKSPLGRIASESKHHHIASTPKSLVSAKSPQSSVQKAGSAGNPLKLMAAPPTTVTAPSLSPIIESGKSSLPSRRESSSSDNISNFW